MRGRSAGAPAGRGVPADAAPQVVGSATNHVALDLVADDRNLLQALVVRGAQPLPGQDQDLSKGQALASGLGDIGADQRGGACLPCLPSGWEVQKPFCGQTSNDFEGVS